MFSRIGKHFTYANVTATFALVLAMSGGAYAASKILITSTKQISPKVVKSLKGAAGSKGATGSQGSPGAAGPAGPQGPQGAPGTNGSEGPEGKTGAPGKDGSPWTVGGTLPVGSSETGQWSIGQSGKENEFVYVGGISFLIPLAAAPGDTHSHIVLFEEGEGEANEKLPEEGGKKLCSGNFEKPRAASGNLCVFASAALENLKLNGFVPGGIINEEEKLDILAKEGFGAGKSGATLLFSAEAEGSIGARGTWVVTG